MIRTPDGEITNSELKTLRQALIPLIESEAQENSTTPYQSITLCLIDAIFSINARYESVKNVVSRYCDKYKLQERRTSSSLLPPAAQQDSIAELVSRVQKHGPESFAENVLRNRCRTSPTNGILKAEAVLRLAKMLRKHGVNHLQDVSLILENGSIWDEWRMVPGQRSGISFKYFLMETGQEELVKPDRMLLDWLERTLDRKVTATQAQALLTVAAASMGSQWQKITPRKLDFLIWNHERGDPSRRSPPEAMKARCQPGNPSVK